jgi:hypothetical protein
MFYHCIHHVIISYTVKSIPQCKHNNSKPIDCIISVNCVLTVKKTTYRECPSKDSRNLETRFDRTIHITARVIALVYTLYPRQKKPRLYGIWNGVEKNPGKLHLGRTHARKDRLIAIGHPPYGGRGPNKWYFQLFNEDILINSITALFMRTYVIVIKWTHACFNSIMALIKWLCVSIILLRAIIPAIIDLMCIWELFALDGARRAKPSEAPRF